MMAQHLEVPKFQSESDEAQWWFANQDAIDDEFELAAKEGRLGHGRAVQQAMALNSVLLELEDVLLARQQADSRGMEYQAYLKMVVHRALLMEQKST